MESKFLSVAQVREALGISPATCWRRLKDKSIPSVKVGARVLIPASFLDSLAAQAIGGKA
jgi:excisionase family DNA binding protein